MNDAFQAWISSQECYAVLKACARQVIKRAERLSLQLDDAYLDRNDYLSAVTNQLWDFVKDRADKIARKATPLLISGDEDEFMVFLSQEFIDFCLDKRRETSPFHAYYRHVRTVLSEAKNIRFESKGRKGSYFAYSESPTLDFLPDSLNVKSYAAWPATDVAFCEIHGKSAILRLSRHFWDEMLRRILAEYLVPVRELVRYVTTAYPLLTTESPESSFDVAEDDDGAPQSIGDRLITSADSRNDDAWKRQLPLLELDIIDTQLDGLARDCASELSDKQKMLILMKLEDDLTYEEICSRLGECSPSKLHYHVKTGLEIIRHKWSLWGPPSLKQFAEVDQEEFFMFYEKVIGFCKNDEACRDSRKGTQA
jgi:hypothetical protein